MKNKSLFGSILGFCLFALIPVVSFISCEVGLGEAVDVLTPELSITYPLTGSIVRGKFALSGTCEDDGKIDSISVYVHPTDDGGNTTSHEFKATVNQENKTWVCVIDPFAEKDLIIDGSYEATIEIKDTAKHVNSKSRQFTIDNTPPVLAVTRPSAVAPQNTDSTDYDSYGQDFIISGHVGDACDSKYMTVTIYDMEGNELYTSPSKIKIDSDFSVTLASYGAEATSEEKKAYTAIYGTDANAGTKPLLCAITGYDCAELIPEDGSEPSATQEGNKTTFFYMYEGDLYNDVFYPYGTSNAYKILSGTFTSSDARSVTSDKGAAEVKTLLKNSDYQIQKGFFSINPRNNPSFIVSGRDPLKLDGHDFTDNVGNYEISNGSKIVIEISPGLDATPLNEDTLGLYVIECDEDAKPKTGAQPIVIIPQLKNANGEQLIQSAEVISARKACISKSGSTYKLTTTLSLKDFSALQVDHQYLIGIYGNDSKKISIKNLDTEYGFRFISTGSAPELSIGEPAGSVNYYKLGEDILVSGWTRVSNVLPELTIEIGKKDSSGDVDFGTTPYKVFKTEADYGTQNVTTTTSSSGIKKKAEFSCLISKDKFDQTNSAEYTIKISSTAGGNASEALKTIMYDVDKPTVAFLQEPAFAKYTGEDNKEVDKNDQGVQKKYLNGTVTFKVSLGDKYSAINTTDTTKPLPKVEFIQKNAQGTDEVKYTFSNFASPANQEFEINTADKLDDNKEVKIVVSCSDLAGNVNSAEIVRYVDQSTDTPVIQGTVNTTIAYLSKALLEEGKSSGSEKNIIVANSNLVYNFIDDDGIQTLQRKYITASSSDDEAAKIAALNSGSYTDCSITSGSTNAQFSEPVSEAGKYYFYKFKVIDVNGTAKEYGPLVILVSADNPILTYKSGNTYVTTNTTSISPDASTKIRTALEIGSTSGPFKIYRKVVAQGVDPGDFGKDDTDVFIQPDNTLNYTTTATTFTDEFTPEENAGVYDICYRVKDSNNHYSNIAKNQGVVIDNTKPVVAITTPAAGAKLNTNAISESNYRFKGTFTEANIDTLYYKVLSSTAATPAIPSTDWEDWEKGVSIETGNWNFAQPFAATTDEGNKKLCIYAVDRAGNVSDPATVLFDVDMAAPAITTTIDSSVVSLNVEQKKNSPYTFSFKIDETNGLDSANPPEITVKKGSTALVFNTGYKIKTGSSYISALTAIEPAKDYLIEIVTGGDEVYSYDIKVKDKAQKETTVSRSVRLDTTPPVINVNKPDVTKWQSSQAFNVIGTADDPFAGTSAVYYALNPSPIPVIPSSNVLAESSWTAKGWTSADGSDSWNISLSNVPAGANNKLYLAAVDTMGNVSTSVVEKTLKVDPTTPIIEPFFYQFDTGSLDDAAGTLYVNRTHTITVYGTYIDKESQAALTNLTFAIGGEAVTPTSLTFCKGAVSGNDSATRKTSVQTILSSNTAPTFAAATSNELVNSSIWKATFAANIPDGSLTMTGYNGAGGITQTSVFTIKVDTEDPGISNIQLSDSYYKESNKKYYINNKGKTFTLTGVATDNIGLKSVTLKVENTATSPATAITNITNSGSSVSSWKFAGIDMKSWSTGAKMTVTVTDMAGNTKDSSIDIIFDTDGPSSKHATDTKGKDVYFRVGDQANDDITTDWKLTNDNNQVTDEWKDELDKDVGGKYSAGTFGNKETITIRGNFDDSGSGVAMIYYKLSTSVPTDIEDFVSNPKAKATGYFAPKDVKRRVFYTGTVSGITAEGNVTSASDGSSKNYAQITSTYYTTISGFQTGSNYLVLVAVDNVGNAKADVVSGTGTNAIKYYHINVDTQAPQTANMTDVYTAATSALKLAFTVTDNPSGTGAVSAGIKSVKVKMNGVDEEQIAKLDSTTGSPTNGKYVVEIDADDLPDDGTYSVSVTALDKAGTGNSDTRVVGSVIVDKTAPTVRITSTPDEWIKNSIGSISVSVNDVNGIKNDIISYNVYLSTDTSYSSSKANGTKTITDGAATVTSITTTNFEDGKSYIVRFTAEDIVGNKTSVNTNPFKVDCTIPTLTDADSGIGIGTREVKTQENVGNANTYFNGETLKVFGTYTDKAGSTVSGGTEITGSGVTEINYSLTPAGATTAITGSWPTTNGTYSSNLAGFKPGSNTLVLSAVDKMGNTSESTTYSVKVDTEAPVISEVNTNDFTAITLTNGTGTRTFSFNVTDSGSGFDTNPSNIIIKAGSRTITNGTGSNASSISVSGNTVTVKLGATDLAAIATTSGTYSVTAKVKDIAGNESNAERIGVLKVDSDKPVPDFTSHQSGATVNKTITLGGTITDESNSAIKEITLTTTCGSTTKTYKYPAGTNGADGDITFANGQWSLSIDTNTAAYNNGTTAKAMSLSLKATDEADNESAAVTLALSIDQNSDRPVVKFTNLVKDDSGNYILKYGNDATLEGTITDDDSTSDKVVTKFYASESAITSADGWTAVSGKTNTWQHTVTGNEVEQVEFNTTTGDFKYIPANKADGPKTVYFYVEDNTGAKFYTSQTTQLTRPKMQFKTDALNETANALALGYRSDSNAPKIVSVALNAYTAASGDNTQTGSSGLGSNCIVGGPSKKYVDINVTANDGNGIKGIVVILEQEGKNKIYYRSNENVSESGVAATAYTASTAVASTTSSADYTYATAKLDISGYNEAPVNVTIKVYDQSGLYSNQESMFVVDNTAPTLTIENFADGDVVYGIKKNTVGGTINGATDVEKIYYAVTKDKVNNAAVASDSIADEDWIEVTGQKISAKIIFGGTNADSATGQIDKSLRQYLMDIYKHDEDYMIDHDDNLGLAIHFKAVDACGNTGYSKRTLEVVPNGDKPTITLTYPVDLSANTHPALAGTIRIYGNAEVGEGSVAAVYVQIDTNYNATTGFNEDGWETDEGGFNDCISGKGTTYTVEQIGNRTDLKGVKATGTLNWNLPINGNKEFNPTGSSRPMAIRIYGVGGSGKVSEYVEQVFTVDPNAPHIGGDGTVDGVMQLKLVQLDNSGNITNQRPYKSGDWVTGQWYVAASVYDDSGIRSITLDQNDGYDKIKIVDGKVKQTAYTRKNQANYQEIIVNDNDCAAAINNVTGKENFDIYIPLPTTEGSGSVNFTIEAVEVAENANSSTENIKINYDNTPPRLGTVGHASYNASAYNVQQDNGFYRIFGYATDTEAGSVVSDMKAVAFYFVRRGTANTRVYDPMWKNKSVPIQTGATNTAGITYEYGMFWNTKTVGRDADLSKLTLTEKDDNIHAGGFVLMDGTIYTIREVSANGKTITLKTEAPAGITTAKFAYAMVIDSFNLTESIEDREKITDSTQYGYGYYGPKASNPTSADDGDLMQEKWASGQWEAWINSANIPDGPIEIHYVALDNAQNYSVGIVGNLSPTDYQAKTTLDVESNGTPTERSGTLISGFDYIYDEDKKAYVSNNAPRIAGVKVGCDYDGNGSISEAEKTTKYVATETIYSSGGSTTRITGVSSEFDASKDNGPLMTVKDQISIEVEIIGGNGNIYNQYNIDTTKKTHSNISSWSKFNNLKYYTTDALTTEINYSTVADNTTVYTKEAFKWLDVKGETDATNNYYTDEALTTKATTSTGDETVVYAKKSYTWKNANGRLGSVIRNTDEGLSGSYYTTTTLPSINFTNAQLVDALGGANANNGTRWFTVELWDSTEETIPYNNSQYAALKLPLDLQVNDKTAPNTVFNDLYWNSSTDNSVYTNPATDKLEGHIELKDYLGTGFTDANYGTDDDKISGKVVFRGYAYDNKRLKSLNWGIKDALTGTIKQAWPQTYITPVQYNPTTGKWGVPTTSNGTTTWTETGDSGSSTIGLPYYYFKVYDDEEHGAYLNENGHKVYWELIVDTSYVQEPGKSEPENAWAVGKDLYVYVEATDNSDRTTNMNPTVVTTGTDAQKLRPNYKVDVVPYITGIKSRLDDNRSSNGRYQIADNEYHMDGTTKVSDIQLIGYNLKQGSANLGIDVPTTSGAYSTTIHNCVTINNLNNNEAVGGITDTTEAAKVRNKYNYQPSSYNNSLTDDVYIQLWQFNNRAARTYSGYGFVAEPVVKFNPANGNLGFAFSNGANRFSMTSGSNTITGPGRNDLVGSPTSYERWEMNYAKYVANALAFDESGRAHGISVGIDTMPSSGKAGRMNYFYSAWGRSRYNNEGGNFNNSTNNGYSLHIDTIGVPNPTDYTSSTPPDGNGSTNIVEERFKSTSMVAVNHNNIPTVYIAYYDFVLERIVFRWGEITNGFGVKDNLTTTTEGEMSFALETNSYSLIAGGSPVMENGNIKEGSHYTPNNAGEYVDIGVVKGTTNADDIVCAVWYDARNQNLMYSYKINPCNQNDASETYTSGHWTKAQVLKKKCGEYCKIAVDANGGIHITAYDSGNKGVGYIYMPTYNTTYTEANNYYLIDCINGPYDELGIDVAVDGTGTTGKAYPTISYYANGTPKMATYSTGILKGTGNKPDKSWENDSFTGKWDVCFVPTGSSVRKDHMNVAQPKNTSGVRARVATGTDKFNDEGEQNYGIVTGNTTTNPILGYAIREGAIGYLEIAQRK